MKLLSIVIFITGLSLSSFIRHEDQIIYYFSNEVRMALKDQLISEQEVLDRPLSSFYATLYYSDTMDNYLLIESSVDGPIMDLVRMSNRKVYIDSVNQIPLMFPSDFAYRDNLLNINDSLTVTVTQQPSGGRIIVFNQKGQIINVYTSD